MGGGGLTPMDYNELAPVRVFRNGISSYFCLNLLPYLLSSQYYHIVFYLIHCTICLSIRCLVDITEEYEAHGSNRSPEKLSQTLNKLEQNYDYISRLAESRYHLSLERDTAIHLIKQA